jgi:hypothetical protein
MVRAYADERGRATAAPLYPPTHVPEERDSPATPVERLLRRRTHEDDDGPRIERRRLQTERSVEGYLTGSSPPRWMERVAEVDRGIAHERERLGEAYRALRAACAGDPGAFARRWRAAAEAWLFDPGLNELIEQHNEWFPIERRLPIDPRTRDYVLINGRSYRRPVLDAAWALEQFPAEPSRRP